MGWMREGDAHDKAPGGGRPARHVRSTIFCRAPKRGHHARTLTMLTANDCISGLKWMRRPRSKLTDLPGEMFEVPAGHALLLATTLPLASFATTLSSAAAAAEQLFTSSPLSATCRFMVLPVISVLKSLTEKSVGEQAACAPSGTIRHRAEASSVFMMRSFARHVARRRRIGYRPDRSQALGTSGFSSTRVPVS